jgi:plastocyanin
MRLLAVLALALACLATPAAAADLVVRVTTPSGAPVRDAVVTVRAKGAASHGPIRFSWPYVMTQKGMQFDPFVLIVPVGAVVAFPNRDPYRHHVYSFSPAKPFELKLYGNDVTRTVKFEKPGVVALGCNIHDQMTAFIRVVDTPYAAKSGANGEALIEGLPTGAVTISVWHPYLKGGRDLTRQATLGAKGARVAVTANLSRPAMRHGGY